MPAKVGVAAEVPSVSPSWPCQEMRKFVDCAETSGMACRGQPIQMLIAYERKA